MHRQKTIIGLSLTFVALLVMGTGPAPGPGTDLDSVASATPFERTGRDKPGNPANRADPTASAAPVTFQGMAFDTCLTRPVATMRAWTASDYGAVGVYFGGRGRGCPKQPNLTPDWVTSVHGMGWHILPLYVGSQSPCVTAAHKRDVRIEGDPWKRGVAEGKDAVRRARSLRFAPGSALYLDMERYNVKNKACARTTLTFVRAWNRTVRGSGYLPGFYSGAGSGVRHMARSRAAGVSDLPGALWSARWRVRPSLSDEAALRAWPQDRRIHQFAGQVKESHGGRAIVIDRNVMHAPVARVE